jgi:hypothetical protein
MTDGERNIVRNVRRDVAGKVPDLDKYNDEHILWVYNEWNGSDKAEPLDDWLRDFHPDADQN